ncbi:phage head morphogenesis protein [Symbiopectobacterium sp.]|uniref:phage head morphogenesis protein n=1 Tax=Symbiopectobacterium sp. TaxID=2952789 RepID=UPI003F346C69
MQTLLAKTPIRRRAPIRPIKPNDDAEKFYRAQLRDIVRQMAQAVDEALVPVLRRNYTADSYLTDILKEATRQASERFMNTVFQRNAERLSQRVVSRAESASSEAFVEQINRAIGIDMTALMVNENLVDYVDASIESNVALIKSLSSDYFEDIQMQVFDGILRGDSLTTIVRNLQHSTGTAYNRAHLIARDQTAKIQADIRFRWSKSQDVRVSGNPAGKYPLAKISCFAISRIDVGMGAGVYLWSRGAKYNGQTDLFPGRAHIGCRCHAIPQIKGLDY